MVHFKKHIRNQSTSDPRNLLELFYSRDRHSSHIEPRPAQVESFDALGKRLEKRDTVLKINTGAGKTTIGLIFLQAQMEIKTRPVVYLCPTIQLVEQVIDEAGKLGLTAAHYAGGEQQPDVRITTASAIAVCTYDKLFNGRSTFDRPEVMLRPGAIVLDDAHTGIDKIRDKFRLTFESGAAVRGELLELLKPSCSTYYPGGWREIESGRPNESLEVPFWIWSSVVARARDIIQDYINSFDGIDQKPGCWYAWPLVRDSLEWSRCVVAGGSIEISPLVLPVEKSRAFTECPHRLFMSATLLNDAALIRDLACSIDAVESPICPAAGRGIGERMVVAPSLVDTTLDRNWIARYCATLAKSLNVVVLTAGEHTAATWTEAGAKLVLDRAVNQRVHELRQGKPGTYTVFAQRYDGIDLPDDACRVLVIDGMPGGESTTDKHDAVVRRTLSQRMVNRIEQGMGRAVRSHVDYAVVLLAGPEVATFVARADVQSAMNPETRAQLRLAVLFPSMIREQAQKSPESALTELVDQCLSRDKDWKSYYQQEVRNTSSTQLAPTFVAEYRMADAIRSAFGAVTARDAHRGFRVLEKAIDSSQTRERPEHLQLLATIAYGFDQGRSMEIQRAAFGLDRSLFCPPDAARRPTGLDASSQATRIRAWFCQFENPNGALAALDELRSRLSFAAQPKLLHRALADFGNMLGAITLRADDELGSGPDVLWLWDTHPVVIEAKTQNQETLHKKDGAQLFQSLNWFSNAYPTRGQPTPVVAAKVEEADDASHFPDSTRVLTEEGVRQLLEATVRLYGDMVHNPLLYSTEAAITQKLLSHKLTPAQFRAGYTVALRRRSRKT